MKAKLLVSIARVKRQVSPVVVVGVRLLRSIETRDVITFGGLAMVGFGLHSVYPPASFVVCGAALFWLGIR